MTCACLLTFKVSPSESPRAPRSTLRPVFDCSSSRKLGAALNERFRPRGRRRSAPARGCLSRSEERRVGKECGARGGRWQERNKKERNGKGADEDREDVGRET